LDLFIDPETLARILGFSIGFLYGESFSELDFKVKYLSQWYKNRSILTQWFIASLLDSQHHFQWGLLLMLLAQTLGLSPPMLVLIYFIGLGLVISDLKDYEYVVARLGLSRRLFTGETKDEQEGSRVNQNHRTR